MLLFSRGFGSVMIITGTSVGAGMLAIPATVAACGFWLASFLLVTVWFVMMLTALLLAEVNLAMPDGTNFSRMAYITLGKSGQIITWVAYLLLLYSLTAAYTVGGGNLVASGLDKLGIGLPVTVNNALFVLVLGLFVYMGTTTVDHTNKILMFIKFLAFFAFVIAILPEVQQTFIDTKTRSINYIWITFPILITSFGFHHIIPTLRSYVKSDRRTLRKSIILGSFIPLVIYFIWTLTTLGSIPVYGELSFQSIIQNGNVSSGIVESYHSSRVGNFAYLFESVAITTSFIGVTLGLFDFNRDTYQLKSNTYINRVIIFIITFLPPFLFAVFYPQGFVIALGYASIFVAVLLIGLPAAMTWIIRKRHGKNHILSKLYLSTILAVALLMIILELLTLAKLLPTL
ncbi:amino acid permease [Fastidiosibacter lacustris]|uniref:amino acid permease n=1 Tax=Fastidiosibacter lacustris TaxID=2056695 RepID=UPI000E34D730|nr:aromatic amino acid transport family protein [Fastidiosibacter lacustris]